MALRQLSLGGLNRRQAGRVLDGATPLVFGLALLLLTPWRTAFHFGMDEGYELMKGLLVSRGHPLYGAFWNDQPPLHTELLALVFRVFGPSAGTGRLLTVGFAMLLVGALYGLARRGSNRLAGLVAVALLASASGFLELSVSAMLELPAFALGLAAVWAWRRWQEDPRGWWLVASGALFGGALQVKFTSALLLPALAVDFMAWRWRRHRDAKKATNPARRDGKPGPRGDAWWPAVALWLGGAAAVFGLITLLFYRPGTWGVFWASHFSANTYAGATTREAVFQLTELSADPALLASAAVGLGLLGGKRRRELLFPAVLLATVLAVHGFHRPYWTYYRLHFAIPLAWLGGVGLVEGFRALWRAFPPATWPARLRFAGAWMLWSLAVSTALTLAPEKIGWELRKLRQQPRGREATPVTLLRAHAQGARWVFTEDRLSAFWAGLAIPPELAVIPIKRLWSGQLTPAQTRAALERYRPELILLAKDRAQALGLGDYLREHYQPVTEFSPLYARR